MTSRLACPNCGAEHTLKNPGITSIVCYNCQTTLYREEAILRAGERSIVGEPVSNLSVGATGTVAGRPVTLIGRVRFEGPNSTWDEWYGTDEQDKTVWLVEDEKNYSLERPLDRVVPDARPTLGLGAVLTVGVRRYQVDEIGEAVCLGGEGQLPRNIYPGQRYRFLDLTEINGTAQISFEFDEQNPNGDAFIGRDVPAAEVIFEPPAGREFRGEAEQASGLNCPNCGGTFSPPQQGKSVVTAICPYCDSILSLEGSAAARIGVNDKKLQLPFAVGDQATLQGLVYEVVGRMVYRDNTGWPSREYLLWSEKGDRYLWMEEESGNYILYRPTARGPALKDIQTLFPKDHFEIANESFQFYGPGRSKLIYVDGALPWRAVVGDEQRFYEFIAPPKCYSIELSGDREMERFIGEHIDTREVYAAFGKEDEYIAPSEAGIATPNPVNNTWWSAAAIFGLFLVVNLFLSILTIGSGPRLVELELWPGRTTAESAPFTIPEGTRVLGMHIDSDVDNSWVYISAELTNAETDALMGATGEEVSYYHGYEGGESWSEGSRDETRYLKAPPAGRYVLSVEVESDRSVPVKVWLTGGDRLGRYPLILALLLVVGPVGIWLKWRAFERDRWDEDEED